MQHHLTLRSLGLILFVTVLHAPAAQAQRRPVDPGVRHAAADSGLPQALPGLGADELNFFQDGMARFNFIEVVSGGSALQGTGNGLGPRFNSNQCASCHLQPTVGGSSPPQNPLIGVATADGAVNTVPWFNAPNGPIREARFVQSNGVRDGGVHNLFVVTGRSDAGPCNLTQPNFLPAGNPITANGVGVLSDIEAFANFMRMLAPPVPAPESASTLNGKAQFISTGCSLCHTPSFTTGRAIATGSSMSPSPALSYQPVSLFSDLLVHHMGQRLADGISQGQAGPDEFRTAPLWGIGQRVFFLHDGRTRDLLAAIEAHESAGSEANAVIQRFNNLGTGQQQDVLNFLRSL